MASSENSLFVEDLPKNIGDVEALVKELFSHDQQIINIQVKSLTTVDAAVVTFETHERAAEALEVTNYALLNKRPIHITWFNPNMNEPEQNSMLVISGLAQSVEDSNLHSLLQDFVKPNGNVIICKVRRNAEGLSNGVATVQFDSAKTAAIVMDKLQGAMIEGQEIKIEFYLPPNLRQNIPFKLPKNLVAIDGASSLDEVQNTYNQFGKIYEILKVEDKFVIFFGDNECVERAINGNPKSQYKLLTTLPKETVLVILKHIESKSVYVNGISDLDITQLTNHFSSVGQIVSIETHYMSQHFVSIQYSNADEAQRAILELDKSILGNNLISVLPFFDRRLQHQLAGLMQLNELPRGTTTVQLRQMFSQYGPIAACAINPTSELQEIGVILFYNYDNAKVAQEKCGMLNVLVLPPCQINDLTTAFIDSDKCPNNCLALYNLPLEATESEYLEKFKAYGPVTGFCLGKTDAGDHKMCFAFYIDKNSAITGLKELRAKGEHAEILGCNSLSRAYSALVQCDLPPEWVGSILYVNNLPFQFGNKEFRENFEQCGEVVAAYLMLIASNGASRRSGVVIYKNPNYAYAAQYQMTFLPAYSAQLTISPFNHKGNIAKQTSPPTQQKQPQIPQMKKKDTPRTFIQRFIELNYPNDAERMKNKVKELSIDQTHYLVQNIPYLIMWLEAK